MTSQTKPTKITRIRYSEEYKKDTLVLTAEVGVDIVAKQLWIHPSQIHEWSSKARLHQSKRDAEREFTTENARLF
ncbi:transposase [Microbulbifer epialgicus]|uniref:Transposase n=1 Tax=Microbulbifer epialgicus TaxID=393907 RepID=A0ABV4P6F4_9GAMM